MNVRYRTPGRGVAVPAVTWPARTARTSTDLDALTARVEALGIPVIRELPAPAIPTTRET